MTSESELQISEESFQEHPFDKSQSSFLKELMVELQKLNSGEDKIRTSLHFMQEALNDKTPRFRDYWDGKRVCLPLFKEVLLPQARKELWEEYTRLSTEARHLKEIIDEQMEFTITQIDLAIQSVEEDLKNYEEILLSSPGFVFPESCVCLKSKSSFYSFHQKELYLLNAFAARINSLRKEVIKTEMRIRYKGKFFERLSFLGDTVFPKRKELIRIISEEFLKDVQMFVENSFSPENLRKVSAFFLRKEIKVLQTLAKELTLDTHAFTQTRLGLSKCWDLLDEYSKEKTKEFNQKKEEFQKNFEICSDKIRFLTERCQSEEYTIEEAMKVSHDILNFMKTVSLSSADVRSLKDAISQARSPLYERLKQAKMHREKEIETEQRQRQEKIEDFKKRVERLLLEVDVLSLETLTESKEALQKQLAALAISQAERELLEYTLKKVRDVLMDKKEKAMMILSQQQLQSLQDLKIVLEEWKKQKQEIKQQLDSYRKILSRSDFDFEKAMLYQELADTEKSRLNKINKTIEDIEIKIHEFENG